MYQTEGKSLDFIFKRDKRWLFQGLRKGDYAEWLKAFNTAYSCKIVVQKLFFLCHFNIQVVCLIPGHVGQELIKHFIFLPLLRLAAALSGDSDSEEEEEDVEEPESEESEE